MMELKQDGEHTQEMLDITNQEQVKTMDVATSPAAMLQLGVSQGLDLDKIERMMELQLKWDAEEARRAYYSDFARFQEVEIAVPKDMDNKQYGSKYASLGSLLNTVTPILGQFGFSARFDIGREGELQQVTCTLTHRLGHSESVTEIGPPDKSGSKNAIQERKSTVTYLRAITFEAVTGISATNEASLDDDGNSAGSDFITPEQRDTLSKMAKEAKLKDDDISRFLKYMKVEDLDTIPAKDFPRAEAAMKKALKASKK